MGDRDVRTTYHIVGHSSAVPEAGDDGFRRAGGAHRHVAARSGGAAEVAYGGGVSRSPGGEQPDSRTHLNGTGAAHRTAARWLAMVALLALGLAAMEVSPLMVLAVGGMLGLAASAVELRKSASVLAWGT